MFKNIFKDKRHMIEFGVGIAILVAMILFGVFYTFETKDKTGLTIINNNFGRILVGLIIGYALARSAFGFAGTVNRACTTGSTKLMKAVLVLFLLGACVTFVAVLGGKPIASLSHNGLNWGLLIGATLFGFGMAFTVCCASGVLTDLAESPLKALFVLLFFCGGAFLGLALKSQSWMAWYKEPIFGIEAIKKGVNFADWFAFDKATNGALGALIITAILVGVFYLLADLYENFRKKKETYIGCRGEIVIQEEIENHVKSENKVEEKFYTWFVKPWSLLTGAVVIAIAYAILMFGLKSGWGVSGPLGQWFGRILMIFGVSAESLASFTGLKATVFTSNFFNNGMYMQDISIFLGALIAFLLAGNFTRNIKGWLFNPLELVLYAVGGIILGIAINLAGGCNAGGLFTPIAQFSLSGWIYLICIIGGGFLGNLVRKQYTKLYK